MNSQTKHSRSIKFNFLSVFFVRVYFKCGFVIKHLYSCAAYIHIHTYIQSKEQSVACFCFISLHVRISSFNAHAFWNSAERSMHTFGIYSRFMWLAYINFVAQGAIWCCSFSKLDSEHSPLRFISRCKFIYIFHCCRWFCVNIMITLCGAFGTLTLLCSLMNHLVTRRFQISPQIEWVNTL